MSIKKIKVSSVFIGDKEIEFTYKNGKNVGKKGHLRSVNVKVTDDCPNFAGKWIKMTMFSDPKHTTQENAEYFKSQNEGKEIYLDVVDGKPYTNKEGIEVTPLEASKPSKAKLEAYLELLEEMGK